ncbi:AraC family transcriptional regulator [Niveispirillum sp. KHB5.9]|uniref:AraC family transcriptional regulator n=1 Tax=Niveispirillum sp. KHB5.9 TaxID=3400269 RepID=UPI003A888FB8
MDPLSDIIALLRPHTAIAKPITGRGRWGVRYAAYRQPGFALMLTGQCWLAVEGVAPLLMRQGDFVLLPATPAFSLYSDPGVVCEDREPVNQAVRHGEPEGEPDVEMLGGTFLIEPVNAPLLLPMLPEMIHIRATAGDTGRLTSLIRLVMDECAGDRPGRAIVLERLLEVMLVECLRWPGNGGTGLSAGLLAGMRDPALAGVLRLMHGDVRGNWTVADLARRAGMSRSAFAARFSEGLGCGPMEYLARWRMSLARDALSRGATSLDRLAEEIGYESASAFSTAFRRHVGCPPGAFARQHRGAIGLA